MKKILFILVSLLLFASVASAETWYKVNQATFAWDAVTTLVQEDGTTIPVPATDVIRYNVFVKDRKTGAENEVAHEILETQFTISFPNEGFYYLGAQTVRYVSVDGLIPSGDPPLTSAIAWSSDAAACLNNDPFGVRNHLPPGNPKNLKTVQ